MTAEDASRSRRIGPNERFVTAVLTSFVRLTSTQAVKSHQRCLSCVLVAGFVSVASALIAMRSYCAVSPKIVTSPQVNWLFFKARAKRLDVRKGH